MREKQLSHIFLFTLKKLKKITLWQAKTAILYVEYENIGVIKTDFHELCGIVNTPGGAALARFVQEIQIHRWPEILLSYSNEVPMSGEDPAASKSDNEKSELYVLRWCVWLWSLVEFPWSGYESMFSKSSLLTKVRSMTTNSQEWDLPETIPLIDSEGAVTFGLIACVTKHKLLKNQAFPTRLILQRNLNCRSNYST